MLGQHNTDWIETIVIVAVVALPVLNSIAKTLIRTFTPRDQRDEPASRLAGPKVPRRDASGWRRPVARPLPPRPVPPVAPVRPAVPGRVAVDRSAPARRESMPVPETLRDVLSEVIPELVPPRARPPRARPHVETATKHPSPAKQKPRVVSRERRAATTRPPESQAGRSKRARSARRRADGVPRTGRDSTEQRLGHLSSNLGSQEDTAVTADQLSSYSAFPRNPTRQALRAAIVMNEILGPPVALRMPEDARH